MQLLQRGVKHVGQGLARCKFMLIVCPAHTMIIVYDWPCDRRIFWEFTWRLQFGQRNSDSFEESLCFKQNSTCIVRNFPFALSGLIAKRSYDFVATKNPQIRMKSVVVKP